MLFVLGLLLSVTARGASIAEELKVDITDKFTYCWGSSESVTHNADGSLTYKSKDWGGMVYWVGDKDWSEYVQVVFELAEPSPCAVQPLVLYPDDQPSDAHYMNAGTTTAYVDLSPIRHEVLPELYTMASSEQELEQMMRDIGKQEKLNEALIINMSIGKVIYLSRSSSLNLNLSLNNLLNNTHIQTGGYQQGRFDYKNYTTAKFPNKYYYAQGFRMYLNVGVRF